MSENWSGSQNSGDMDASGSDTRGGRDWRLIEGLVKELVTEKRRARRWGVFFKLLIFVYLFGTLWLMFGGGKDAGLSTGQSQPHTAVIDVKGKIADDEEASADNIIKGLREAFDDKTTKGVILKINSPGGSPVQSGYVYDEIKRLRALHPEVPVYAVISDIGASGAYYIAAAADKIYADKASLVGSIGVISSGFGFVDAMEKLGVTRRVYAAGDHKAFLDPFQPPQASETKFWEGVLNTTHKQFIDSVRKGRGDRLKESPELFSGLIWSGEQAKDLGLIDGFGSADYVAREVIGEKRLVNYTHEPNKLEKVLGKLGASAGEAAVSAMGLTPELR